jgi:hypothetical protein
LLVWCLFLCATRAPFSCIIMSNSTINVVLGWCSICLFCVMLLSYFERTFGGIMGYRVCNHVLQSACKMVSFFLWVVYVGLWVVCCGLRPPRT